MPDTNFQGRLRVGSVFDSTSATDPSRMANVGTVPCVQRYSFAQSAVTSATATGIVLPRNSMILSIDMFVFIAFTGTTPGLDVGLSSANVDNLIDGQSVGAVGRIPLTTLGSSGSLANWASVGSDEVELHLQISTTGTGLATIFVEYLPQEVV